MLRKIFFLLAIFMLSLTVTFAAAKPSADTQQDLSASVVDTSKVLSANQIQTLNKKIQQVEQKHKIKIGINFLNSIGNNNIDTVANERLRKYFSGSENGGIILVVVMDSRKWNIALDANMNQKILSYSTVAYRNDDFYNKLHDNDFFGAANAYIDSVDELLNYYEKNGTAYDPSSEFNPEALGLAVLLAIVLGFGVRSWLIGSMSNVRYASEARDYLKRESVRITEQRDTYLFTNVSRRPKAKSSGHSGGGRSGGGSSGGGSF